MIGKYVLLAAGLGLAFTFTIGCAGQKAAKIEQEQIQLQRNTNLDNSVDNILDQEPEN
jgi:hypothetical protein